MERIQAAIKRQSNAPLSGGRRLLQWDENEWKMYQKTPPFGGLVDNIVPVRPPLSTLYELHYETSFKGGTPTDLMEALIEQAKKGKVYNVATVIDATGNGLYYHEKGEWTDWDVNYVKVPVEDMEQDAVSTKEIVPTTRFVEAFLAAVQRHFAGDRREEHIAVYGARGYNTAAFLIVCYLVEIKGVALNEALERYKQVNPPGVYSNNCLETLYKRYYSTLRPSGMRLLRPDPPSWDSSAADDSPSGVGPDILTEEDKANPFVLKTKTTPAAGFSNPSSTYTPSLTGPAALMQPSVSAAKSKKRKIRTWEDDVEPFPFGEPIEQDSQEHRRLLAVVAELTGIPEGFPGCEAISLTKTHIRDYANPSPGSLTKEYLVTWRARGTRCLLLALKDGNYLVSRRMTFTKVNVKFPRKRAMHENTDKTLVDGVLVEDRDGSSVVLRYLAFDMIAWEGSPVWKSKLEKRLQCLQNEIILPRKAVRIDRTPFVVDSCLMKDKSLEGASESFRVRMKDHFRLEKTEHLLRNFIPRVTHNVDGLILTPKLAVYGVGGYECDEPLFKFVVDSSASIMGSLDGSLTEAQLLQYITRIPK
ncbi:unnamed protein product [Aphanomyces euteiches]